MKRFFAAVVAALLASPVAGEDLPFDRRVDQSIGYVNIGPGLLLIEDDVSSSVCRVHIPDVFFLGYAEADPGAMAEDPPQIVCVPSVQLSQDAVGRTPDDIPFNVLVDESIGYANIGPGLVLIEDDVSSVVCRIELDDAYFRSYAEGAPAAMRESAPLIICVPSPDLTQ